MFIRLFAHFDEVDLLPISDGLLNKYNVIFKGHIEDQSDYMPENAIIAPTHNIQLYLSIGHQI
jgi:hypothetical protein